MENLPTITNIIGQYGFPIVACSAVMYYVWEFTAKLTEQITSMNTVLTHLLDVLEDNTKVISEVSHRMNGGEEDV